MTDARNTQARLPYGAGHRLPHGERLAFASSGCRHDHDGLFVHEMPLITCECGEITGRRCPDCGQVF